MPTETIWGTVAIIPSIEAVEDMKINTQTYDAEVGRTEGGVYYTTYKSGTNQIHGDLFGSIRRTGWDANYFFNNSAGLPLLPQPNNNWAGSMGGPLTIPHLYNGKDRTFWFISYEGYDNTFGGNGEYYVPTALEKQGDFSQTKVLVNGALQPMTIYDPLTTVLNPDGTYSRTPFPNNTIPANRLDPVGKNFASYFPSPMTQPAYYGQLDILGTGDSTSPGRYYMGKLDEQFTKWWRATASYTHEWTFEPQQCFFCGPASPNQYALKRDEDITSVNSTITISPTTVLAARWGFARWPNYLEDFRATGFNPANLGFPQSLVSQMQGLKFPDVTFAQTGYNFSTDYNQYWNFPQWATSAMVSHSAGRHSLKFGFDYRRMEVLGDLFNAESGDYTFNGIFTQSSPVSPAAGTGADIADLLLGYPYSGTITKSSPLTDRMNYYAVFGQDDFRVTPKLTLNLGLRWEREYFGEVENRIYVGFDGNASNPLANYVTGLAPKGVIEWAGQNGNPTHIFNPNNNKLSPRLGAAYQIDNRTVIRGGFGIFWGAQYTGTTLSPAGFLATTPFIATTNGYATPFNTLSNPFPTGILQPVGLSAGSLTGVGQSVSIPDPQARSPRVAQYSVDVQRQLPANIGFEVGYVGLHGSDLPWSNNENLLDPSTFAQGAGALTQSVPNPFYATPGAQGVLASANIPRYQLLLPYITYSNVEFLDRSLGSSHYDSLIIVARKRTAHGLTFINSVTWGRGYDYGTGAPQDPYNMSAERAAMSFVPPIIWGLGLQYELPAGKGKPLLNNNAVADYFLGGWQFNMVTTVRSGLPINMTQVTNNNAQFGYESQRPNATGVSPQTSGSIESRLNDYLNPAAFTEAPEFTFGNSARYIPVRNPGVSAFDLSLFKTVSIKESFKVQFRAEAINAFNTPQFNNVNSTVGSPSFGEINGEQSIPRQMQLDLRFMW